MKQNDMIRRLQNAMNNAGISVLELSEEDFLLTIDSVEIISLIVEIESEFNITISENEYSENMFASLHGIRKLIEKEICAIKDKVEI